MTAKGPIVIALPLFGVASATMADFDLAAMSDALQATHAMLEIAAPAEPASPYLLPKIEEQSTSEHGIRVRIHGRKVKLTIPIGPS